MPSDKTVVNLDETEDSSRKDTNNKYEVELQKGTWLEGAEGFQFNKKCKVRVEGKFLKKTNRTRVSINTFSTFRDEKNNEDVKEPLGQTIETNLEKVNKDSMEAVAEAQVPWICVKISVRYKREDMVWPWSVTKVYKKNNKSLQQINC